MKNNKGFTLIELLIVVAIIGIIAAIAIPSLLNALDRARQTTSVENLQKLGQCVEEYLMDHNRVGCPKTGAGGGAAIVALQTLFKALEYNENDGMLMDGWSDYFVYEFEAALGGKNYTLTSYGSDAVAGPAPATPGVVKKFPEDLIFARGAWVQRPEGAQTSK